MQPVQPDSTILIEIVQTKMPYGKYKGAMICDLPAYYLEWMSSKGFPPGKMGMLLSTTYEIKTNGLNSILNMVKKLPEKWVRSILPFNDHPPNYTNRILLNK